MKKNITIIVLVLVVIILGMFLFLKMNKNDLEVSPAVENPIVDNDVVSDCLPTTVPWIKVLSPNGGETYTAGQQIEVKWKSCNVDQPVGVTFLDSNDDGFFAGGWVNGSIGLEKITLPISAKKGDYKIIINTPPESENGASDSSDNTFTINSAISNTYLVPGKFSFSYDKDAQIDVPPLVNAFDNQSGTIKVFSGKTEEYISWEKDGSKFNPDGINPATLIGNETFGKNIYKVYKITSEYTPVRVLGYSYILLYPNSEAVIIEARHDINIPMMIDLASVGFE